MTEERIAKLVTIRGNDRTARRPRKGAVAAAVRPATIDPFGLSLLLGLVLGLAGLLRLIGP